MWKFHDIKKVCKYCTIMSCTSVLNANFIFYCTKQSRGVPMSWFLFGTQSLRLNA